MQQDDVWNRLCDEMTAAFGRKSETVKPAITKVCDFLIVDRNFPVRSLSGSPTQTAEIVIKTKFGKELAKKRLPLQEDDKLNQWALRWLARYSTR